VKQRYFGGCPNWQTTYEQLRQVLNDQGLNDGAFAEWPPDRRVVDPRGFEPLTFWLPARRSTS
jgi:hypothetical protein